MIYWLPAVIYALIIFTLSHQSQLPYPGREIPDYLSHFVEYFVFGLTLAWGKSRGFKQTLSLRSTLLLWALALLYAMSDEYHQSFVVGRTSSAQDWLFDALGAFLSLLITLLWTRKHLPQDV